jgi:hypothetical protein
VSSIVALVWFSRGCGAPPGVPWKMAVDGTPNASQVNGLAIDNTYESKRLLMSAWANGRCGAHHFGNPGYRCAKARLNALWIAQNLVASSLF